MTDWSGRPAYAQVADTLRADIRAGRCSASLGMRT